MEANTAEHAPGEQLFHACMLLTQHGTVPAKLKLCTTRNTERSTWHSMNLASSAEHTHGVSGAKAPTWVDG
jgi:hypothetical protein